MEFLLLLLFEYDKRVSSLCSICGANHCVDFHVTLVSHENPDGVIGNSFVFPSSIDQDLFPHAIFFCVSRFVLCF